MEVMSCPRGKRAIQDNSARLRLRCFFKIALLLALVTGFCRATAAYAAACSVPPELGVNKLQGTVYGPSGITVPQILVLLSRDGKSVSQTKTDGRGKFEFKVGPGLYDLQLLFHSSKAMDLKVRVGRGHGGLFHPARLQIVLGLSGTRCGFATTSSKEFKKAIKRYQGLLQEKNY
jgi:hypothetical protein